MNTVPTIGFNCERVRGFVGRSRNLTFLVWDVGGQEKIRPLWKPYTRATDAIIFVVDSCETADRMEEARLELHRIMRTSDNMGVPLLVRQINYFKRCHLHKPVFGRCGNSFNIELVWVL